MSLLNLNELCTGTKESVLLSISHVGQNTFIAAGLILFGILLLIAKTNIHKKLGPVCFFAGLSLGLVPITKKITAAIVDCSNEIVYQRLLNILPLLDFLLFVSFILLVIGFVVSSYFYLKEIFKKETKVIS